MAGSRNIPHGAQALSSSPWAHWAAYEAAAGTGEAAGDGAALEGMVNVADVGGGAEDAAFDWAAAVADRNCACWAERGSAVEGRWDFVGSGRRAEEEDSYTDAVDGPPDYHERSDEWQAEDSSQGAAGGGDAEAVEQHCGMDRCLVGEEGPRRERGGTWAKRQTGREGR